MTNNINEIEVSESTSPDLENSIESQDSFQGVNPLPVLLSELAALLGNAVPAFRFSMLEHSKDGLEISKLPLLDQAKEMWKARFPGSQIREIQIEKLLPGDFPLLWISSKGDAAQLVRGRLASGDFSTEDKVKKQGKLLKSNATTGTFVALRVDESVSSEFDLGPQTASDWLVFAIRKHRRVYLEGIFATFIVSAISMVTAMYSMQVYDRVLPTKGYSTLIVLTIGALLAIILEFTLKQVRAHMIDRASKSIDLELSSVFFGKALDVRMDVRPPTVGTFVAQIRYFESVRNFMTSSTLFILADAPFALMFIGVMALIAGPVAIVPLITVPISIFSGLYARKRIERATEESMAESNRKSGLMIEAIDGVESIKAAGGEWKMLDRFRDMTSSVAVRELEIKNLTNRSASMAQFIQQLNYISMIGFGVYVICNGELTQGGLIACSIISGRALAPMAQLPSFVLQWQNAKSALKSLDAIMALPSDRPEGKRMLVPDNCNANLSLSDVVFSYGGGRPAIEVSELKFKAGERVAVIGSVGSGKSSLIKVLSGLYKPKSGTVNLDAVDVDHLAPEYVREHIGYLPQDIRLFNGSLRENITLGLPTPSDSVILHAAKLTDLDQVILNHPKGLELEINEGGRGLSGGQRQLVGLTRLLISKPKIMLLDEPTASMDGQLEIRIMQHLFKEVSPETLIIVVTHKLAILPHVDRIVVVEKGKVVLDGPKDKVLERLSGKQT